MARWWALIYADKDGHKEPKRLHVYFNIGEVLPRDALGCYLRMLNANFKPSWKSSRIYSICPQTCNALSFLRLDMNIDPLVLARLIVDEIEVGIQEFIERPSNCLWRHPSDFYFSKKRCASNAAIQPVPALVIAWR